MSSLRKHKVKAKTPKTKTKSHFKLYITGTFAIIWLITWTLRPSENVNQDTTEDLIENSKQSESNRSPALSNSHQESQSPDATNTSNEPVEPFIHPDTLSQDDLIHEASTPNKRTLDQRSLTLQVVLNNKESIPQEKLKEVALQQLRAPLLAESIDDSHYIFHHFFSATGLYIENDSSHGLNTEEFADTVFAQPSMIARKAMLVRFADAAPDHIDAVVKSLNKRGIIVPSLDGSPTENLPEMEEASQ